MLTGLLLVIAQSVYTLSADETSAVSGLLNQPVLASGEFQNEIRQFLKHRIPPLKVPETAKEWQNESEELRRRIFDRVVFRGVPEEWYKNKPQIVWGDVIKTDKGYLIRKLRYEALPGFWVPALLYEPEKSAGKIPAILNVNGHVGPPGKTQDYEQIRCINLAKRGMLALHPEWLLFGELNSEDFKHNRQAYLDLCGVSGLSVFFLAMKRGIDVLEMNPKTDIRRIAMTGLSGGGWQTIILSSLDKRISATAPNAGYIGLDYRADFIEDTGDVEQNPNDLLTIADYTHLTAMLAPRPALLIYNEKDDCCFQSYRARPSVFEPVIPFYKLSGKIDDFQFYNNKIPGTHNYDKDNREQFYKFINHHFMPQLDKMDAEIPSDDEVLKYEDLIVGIPDNNANFFTLASGFMEKLPLNRPPENDSQKFAEWMGDGRKRLRDVLRLNPMTAKASISGEAQNGDLKATYYKLSMNGELSVPAIAVSKTGSTPDSVVIMFADKGKSTITEHVEKLVNHGALVVAVDPIFMGECVPQKGPVWQYTQMLSAVGERSLGVQVAQIGAVIEWACQEFKTDKVSLFGSGWNASIAAISACGLYNKVKIAMVINLASLKSLIQNHLDYETYPVLFCFGLLEQFDIQELIILCSPGRVEIIQ